MPVPDGAFSGIAGNASLISFFRDRIESGTLAHAYTLEGPDGSGKTLIAYAVAAAVSGPEFADKVRSGNSADVKLIVPESGRRSVSVDEIRAIKEDAAMTPNELDCRFYIFAEAQDMSAAAQNTLLKLLEEPPAGVYFLLLCTSAAGLLPTVRSRAPVLRMELLPDDEIKSWLKSQRKFKNLDDKALDLAVRVSHGTIGGAAAAAAPKTLAGESSEMALAESIVTLSARASSGDAAARAGLYSLLKKLPQDRKAQAETIEKAEYAVRDLMLYMLSPDSNVDRLFFADDSAAEAASAGMSAASLVRTYDIFEETIHRLSMNVNVYAEDVSMLTRLIGA